MFVQLQGLANGWLSLLLLFVTGIACISHRILAERNYQRKYKFPPIVPGLPLVGNAFQIPKTNQGPYFAELAKKYGEMFTIKIGGTYWVILNSQRTAIELLGKRAAKYSSRMDFPMANELVSRGNRILLMPYGDLWRSERKIIHKILNSTQMSHFEPFQDVESRVMLLDYLQSPEGWFRAHGRYSNSVIMSFLFGKRSNSDDPHVMDLYKTSEAFVQYLMPGKSIVDAFPILARITFCKCLQPWRWTADVLYERTLSVYKRQFNELAERTRKGVQRSCFVSEFLESGAQSKFTPEQSLFIAGTLLEAGSDTSRMTLDQTVAGAALFPDWVQRARIELDNVCGHHAERLPAFADMPRLPLIRAAIKEAIRWKPSIAETGIPHATTQDDEFEGYQIPAGTVVTWNHWGIANDPNEYVQPERFWPERFLNEELDKPLKGHLGFGAG
ncbi:cytochrome P450 monooxygenase-like protein 20 [Elsinoe australis]|uniref:Cytochrome P450 monooxygenase-like protein 20 n=1 Tax=Elsinoe australis TaxID=40998 RepID=A0A4U7B0L7_9PEZI|nr:cytochrome P450 monooxygenase-like protein 20 [Elsinoe australis]